MGKDLEKKNKEDGSIWVVASDTTPTRGRRRITPINTNELSVNVNLFVQEINKVLEKTPTELGKFRFEEIEIYAEVTAKGTLALLGTGGEVGSIGGIKFIFRRALK